MRDTKVTFTIAWIAWSLASICVGFVLLNLLWALLACSATQSDEVASCMNAAAGGVGAASVLFFAGLWAKKYGGS